MAFNSIQYALFLALLYLIYWRINPRGRIWLLVLASYLFYSFWDWRFLSLILISTATDFAVGRYLAAESDQTKRKRALLVSIVMNIGLLGLFKYFGFFVESAGELLNTLGLQPNLPSLKIILPVGISFYTFQTLSYTIDVYRRKIEAVSDPVLFAAFVAFFPQLVAGPIERADHLIPQLARPPERKSGDVLSAIGLISLGLFKKVAIADMAATAVNEVFADPARVGPLSLALGVYAFALQIYGDFSGYTDIARGSARLLGIELSINFNQPYLSRSITEFWRRWHITLSSWLRDYLYIPLGGNRSSRIKTYRNLILTMLLGGLWHGAAWTFVIWGGFHGLALAAERASKRTRAASAPLRPSDLVRVLITFHVVCLGWIFFRADSLGDALTITYRLATFASGDELAVVAFVPILGLITLGIDIARRTRAFSQPFALWPLYRQAAALSIFVLGLLIASGGTQSPFIYFQF